MSTNHQESLLRNLLIVMKEAGIYCSLKINENITDAMKCGHAWYQCREKMDLSMRRERPLMFPLGLDNSHSLIGTFG